MLSLTGTDSRSINGREKHCAEVTCSQELFYRIHWGGNPRKIWAVCLKVLVADSHLIRLWLACQTCSRLCRLLSIFGKVVCARITRKCFLLPSVVLFKARNTMTLIEGLWTQKWLRACTPLCVCVCSLVGALWVYLCRWWNDIPMNFVSLNWCLLFPHKMKCSCKACISFLILYFVSCIARYRNKISKLLYEFTLLNFQMKPISPNFS